MTEFKRHNLSACSYYLHGRIPPNVCPDFDTLLCQKPEALGSVVIFGKPVATPRYTAHYLRPYTYTGAVHDAEPLPDELKPILDWANETFAAVGKKLYNQALVNYYMDGNHYIGKHSDDERQMARGSSVFSASFGQSRIFRIRNKKTRKIVQDIEMSHGTYIVMCGDMQKEFTHEVPKVMGEKGKKMKTRINVTFRSFT